MGKKILLICGGIVLLLIITNPSIKDFKDYLGVTSYDGLHKKQNWFVCSVFERQGNEYVGVAGNMFRLAQQHQVSNTSASTSSSETTSVSEGLRPFVDDTTKTTTTKSDPNNPFMKSLREFKKTHQTNQANDSITQKLKK